MSSQERRLMRRLANAQSGAIEARAPRGGLIGPDPEYVREQQDRERTHLAAELLKIGLEDARIGDFTDAHKRETMHRGEKDEHSYTEDVPVLTVEQWFTKLAEGALRAAEIIYPEIPEPTEGKGA